MNLRGRKKWGGGKKKKKSDIFYSHRCFGNHEIRRIPSGARKGVYRWYLHTKGDGAAHPQGSRWDGCWWTVTPTGYSSLLLLRKFQGKGRHSTQTASVVTHAYQPSITQALAAFSHPQPTPTSYRRIPLLPRIHVGPDPC